MSKKQDIIKITAELLQIQGYHATGLNEIIAKSGSPKGSLYYYFKNGKDEIVIAALRYSGEEIRLFLENAAHSTSSFEEFITTVIDYYANLLTESNFQKGCPVATTALEISGMNPEIDQAIKSIYESWKQIIITKLSQKLKDKEVIAEILVSLVEGALISAKIQRNKMPLEYVKKVSNKLI